MLRHALRLAGNRPHKDDPPADLEMLVRLARDEELAARVDGEHPVELVLGDVLEMAERHDARVGAHYVEPLEVRHGLLEQSHRLGDVCDVGFDGDRVGPEFFYLFDHFGGCVDAVRVVDDYFSPASGQLEGHRFADAPAWLGCELGYF